MRYSHPPVERFEGSTLTLGSTEPQGAAWAPGFGWLVAWMMLLWLGLLVSGVVGILYSQLLDFDFERVEGMPGSAAHLRSFATQALRFAVLRFGMSAFDGLAIGAIALLLIRKCVPRSYRFLIVVPAGLAVGAFLGALVGESVAYLDRNGLYVASRPLFLVRQIGIGAAFSSSGLAVAAWWVWRDAIPRPGAWWAVGWALFWVLSELTVPVLYVRESNIDDPDYLVIGALGLFVATPLFVVGSGLATVGAFRFRRA